MTDSTTAPATSSDPVSGSPPGVPAETSTRDRRARTRRSVAVQRAAWMSSRARNAARRGPLIAAVGGLAVIATLLALVLLPREVDRAIRAQLQAIPAATDTAPVLTALVGARERRTRADAALRIARTVAAVSPVLAVGTIGIGGDSSVVLRDSASVELLARLTRARSAPLVESYRALAESRLLRDDGRVRAIVDSIDGVDREREAYAALGGPDARYAALTARLATLGQRMVRLGEATLAERAPAPTPAPTPLPAPAPANAVPPDVAAASAANMVPPTSVGAGAIPLAHGSTVNSVGSGATVTAAGVAASPTAAATGGTAGAALDSTSGILQAPLLNPRGLITDIALVNAAKMVGDTVVRLEATLDLARRTNGELEARRAALRTLGGVTVPPFAMLLAALVVGLALGYASAVVRELRRPTVGDEGEVERLAHARVITHAGSQDAVRDARSRRRADRSVSPVLDPTADAWQQLHLTLTGHGDVVRTVRIVADDPLLGDALAINLAAAAARESRATLLIEPPSRTPLLGVLLRQSKLRGLQDVQQGRTELREVITEVAMGRDASVDVLFGGTPVHGVPAAPKGPLVEEMRRVAARYDLTLVTGDASSDVGVVTHDVIICARLGVTSLAWLSNATVQARGGSHRLRAVLLWATDAPSL